MEFDVNRMLNMPADADEVILKENGVISISSSAEKFSHPASEINSHMATYGTQVLPKPKD